MLFDGWDGILRTLAIGVCAYALLIVMLRTSGKRTLAKMNAFDLVVTVALGSTLATILLNGSVALAEGATALLVLIGLQFLVAWGATRAAALRDLVKSTPRALVIDGRIDTAAAREERVTHEEILQAVRASGNGALEGVAAVVLETDGSMSVVLKEKAGSRSALATVEGAAPRGLADARPLASASGGASVGP